MTKEEFNSLQKDMYITLDGSVFQISDILKNKVNGESVIIIKNQEDDTLQCINQVDVIGSDCKIYNYEFTDADGIRMVIQAMLDETQREIDNASEWSEFNTVSFTRAETLKDVLKVIDNIIKTKNYGRAKH